MRIFARITIHRTANQRRCPIKLPLLILGTAILLAACDDQQVTQITAYPQYSNTAKPTRGTDPSHEPTSPPLQAGTEIESTATQTPSKTLKTPNPTSQESPTAQFIPVKGGADQITFIKEGEIWISNLDGKGLFQASSDDENKSNLRWSNDGSGVMYLSGPCLRLLDIERDTIRALTCFGDSDHLTAFEISPDGRRAAVSLNGQLFVITYDSQEINQVRTAADLIAISECPELAPYHHRTSQEKVNGVLWSSDGARLAILRQGTENSQAVELIQVLDISACSSPLPRLDEFPSPRFEMKGYQENPTIQNFAWDGKSLFALTSNRRNDGFGDLWIYDSSLHRAFEANPIQGKCCYRDPVFSPDGEYLAFVFQDAQNAAYGPAEIYYLPFDVLDTSIVLPPMKLPADFFSNPRAKPQPALRAFLPNN